MKDSPGKLNSSLQQTFTRICRQIKSVLFIFVFARITFIPAALLIGVWFVIQLVHAGAVAHVQKGGVGYLAHVGGFVFGALTARFFENPRREALQRPRD